jgi:hypothetical protein
MANPEAGGKPSTIEFYGVKDVYSESGIDLTLLRANLARTLEERLEDNRRSALFCEALRQSGRKDKPGPRSEKEVDFMLDAPALIRLLLADKVEFVLIGGLAMIAHGSAHVTKDADFCYGRTPDNLAALVRAFTPIQPYLRGVPAGLPFRFDVPTLQAGLNFTLTTDCGDVDLLGEVSGVGNYEQALRQSEEHTLFGMTFRVLSLDGLIVAKRAAGRLKDRNHLLELEELRKLRDAGQQGA